MMNPMNHFLKLYFLLFIIFKLFIIYEIHICKYDIKFVKEFLSNTLFDSSNNTYFSLNKII